MDRSLITRRNMIRTAGGILVAGGLTSGPGLLAQQATQEQTKQTKKDLIFRTTDPRNGEPQLAKLVRSWQTPTELFYVRSHAPNPVIDPKQFRLTVEGMVRKPLTLTLDELKQLSTTETTATLTCAGNRRSEYNGPEYKDVPKVGGVQWAGGTIGNASWAGTLLANVLKRAEVTENARHVWFEGLDEIEKKGKVIGFGGSIPIEKAMVAKGPGAPLITHTMNGQALTPDHGYPLRMVVPGYIGARSVKWLGKIVVSDRPSPNHYVATAYKIVKKTDPIDWSETGPIYRFPINGAICTPAANSNVAAGEVELTGYALPTGRSGSNIKSVLISTNDGKTWTRAELTGKAQDFCWQLWKAKIKVDASTNQIMMRATDTSGGFMPHKVQWNAKGYLRNPWYRLPIQVG